MDSFNPNPAMKRAKASIARGSPKADVLTNILVIDAKLVEPVKPNIKETAYNNIPVENAPKMKYFTAASFD
jgi:hypothetical protein